MRNPSLGNSWGLEALRWAGNAENRENAWGAGITASPGGRGADMMHRMLLVGQLSSLLVGSMLILSSSHSNAYRRDCRLWAVICCRFQSFSRQDSRQTATDYVLRIF